MSDEKNTNERCPGSDEEHTEFMRIISEHPCYDKNAQHKFGRIHLPVAPACNVQCNFCVREFDCVNESRPGVTSKVLTPKEALEKLREVIEKHPFIKVAGIAGPGDPLANNTTFETFELIGKEFPDLTLCMSTNGLYLPEKLPELVRLGVSTLTVTVNAIDPEIIEKIYSHIVYEGKVLKGIEAAKVMHRQQMAGIKAAVEAGLAVKINTVLIPTINDEHIIDIAKKLKELGVYIMNVMPLINQGAFAHLTPPTTQERAAVQKECEPYVTQMKHCRQCRADAYGLIGDDLSQVSNKRRQLINIKT